ncbi:dynein light chain family protein [Candidatus Woesearchaeota archaeon]|nr:dynein light chain family protein [Candidatus Woesearchaeota archaeon]
MSFDSFKKEYYALKARRDEWGRYLFWMFANAIEIQDGLRLSDLNLTSDEFDSVYFGYWHCVVRRD